MRTTYPTTASELQQYVRPVGTRAAIMPKDESSLGPWRPKKVQAFDELRL